MSLTGSYVPHIWEYIYSHPLKPNHKFENEAALSPLNSLQACQQLNQNLHIYVEKQGHSKFIKTRY